MTAALLALAMLEQPECHVRGRALRQLATACRAAEVAHQLPAGILCSVALAETGGRWKVRREKGGSCSVGIFQIYLPGCPSAAVRILRGSSTSTHADAAAWLLRLRWRPKSRFPWAAYNPGSKRWRVRVGAIWGRIRTVAKNARVESPTTRIFRVVAKPDA